MKSTFNNVASCVTCADTPESFLPDVNPESAESEDLPFLGLINPSSGSQAGAAILKEAQYWPTYQARFFDIVNVSRDPKVAEAFSQMLDQVREEARRKMERKPGQCFRPRLICGGGDGTASFAIWCIFRALRGAGGTLRWTDEELEQFFPAFAQLPLGTGNDFAGVLGWGRTMDPKADRAQTNAWFQNALSSKSPVRPLDVWGLFPQNDSMKVCMLRGVDEKYDRPRFKVAGPAVPFLSLLYFSFGYEAFVAAQVECNRTESQLGNKIEYSKAIVGSMVGSRRVNVDLTGVTISVPGKEGKLGSVQYFPPTHRASTGEEFTSVGFMNINSYSAGIFAANDPAIFSDGFLDLFRQKNPAKQTLRRGLRWRTEKHSWAKFHLPPSLPGAFCQYDGEARFVFNPRGEGVDFDVRRVLRIPVVIGAQLEYRKGLEAVLAAEHNGPDFQIVGSEADKAGFKQRLQAWISGKLTKEMNADAEEAERLEEHSARFLQGICARSTRILVDFGTTYFEKNKCAKCGVSAPNKGCKGCRRRFCASCWLEHLGNVQHIQWMYGDANSLFPDLAKRDPLRWSSRLCVDDAIREMEAEKSGRPIFLKVFVEGREDSSASIGTSNEAVEWLRNIRQTDEAAHQDDMGLQRGVSAPPSSSSPSDAEPDDDDEDVCKMGKESLDRTRMPLPLGGLAQRPQEDVCKMGKESLDRSKMPLPLGGLAQRPQVVVRSQEDLCKMGKESLDRSKMPLPLGGLAQRPQVVVVRSKMPMPPGGLHKVSSAPAIAVVAES